MPNVIAVANHRGGVGKSTTTMMLAEGLALFHEQRVLVLDFDPQAMVTVNLIGAAAVEGLKGPRRTVADFMTARATGERTSLFDFILSCVSDIKELKRMDGRGRVDLIPMHPAHLGKMSGLDIVLAGQSSSSTDESAAALLKADIERLADIYDSVLIDCPAGATTLPLAALRVSNVIVVPTLLEQNSLTLVGHYLDYIVDQKLGRFKAMRDQIFLLPTLFVRSNPAQQLLLDRLLKNDATIPVPIPHCTAIQRAVQHAGAGGTRLAREKYNSAHTEFKELADWMATKLRTVRAIDARLAVQGRNGLDELIDAAVAASPPVKPVLRAV